MRTSRSAALGAPRRQSIRPGARPKGSRRTNAADVLGSSAHILLFKSTHLFTYGSFDFALCFHFGLGIAPSSAGESRTLFSKIGWGPDRFDSADPVKREIKQITDIDVPEAREEVETKTVAIIHV